MAQLLYGDKVADSILAKLRKQQQKKPLKLVVIQVGDSRASVRYIREKKEAATRIGVTFELIKFPKGISQKKVKEAVEKAGRSKTVSGIVVQLPLPAKFETQEILDAIPVEKDVDVLSSKALGLYAIGKFPVVPPTVAAIMLLFEKYRVSLQGKHIVLVGAGRLVGLPMMLQLVQDQVTFSSVNEKTKSLSSFTKQADIIISGVGKPRLIKASMVKKGTVIIDAGTSVDKGAMAGDIDFNNVVTKVRAITPVPGGVGPLTVACLLENLFLLQKT